MQHLLELKSELEILHAHGGIAPTQQSHLFLLFHVTTDQR